MTDQKDEIALDNTEQSPFIAALYEPAVKFPFSDFLIFFSNLMRIKLEEQGANTATPVLTSQETLVLSIIFLQLAVAAGSKYRLTQLKNRGKDEVDLGKLGTFKLDKLENTPVIAVGALHLPLSLVMALTGQYVLAGAALCWAGGDITLGMSKDWKKKMGERFHLIEKESGPSYVSLSLMFGEKAGHRLNNIRRGVGLALINPNTYFGTGLGLIGVSTANPDLASVSDFFNSLTWRDLATGLSFVPLAFAWKNTMQNLHTQLKENLPHPPSTGNPMAWFAGTVGVAGLINLGLEASDAIDLTNVFGERSQWKAWTDQLTIGGQFLIAAAYYQFSKQFEGFKLPKLSLKKSRPTDNFPTSDCS